MVRTPEPRCDARGRVVDDQLQRLGARALNEALSLQRGFAEEHDRTLNKGGYAIAMLKVEAIKQELRSRHIRSLMT